MDRNELYLQYAEEVDERLNKKNFKTHDEAWEYFNNIKNEYIDDLDSVLDEIFDDYCEENNLE